MILGLNEKEQLALKKFKLALEETIGTNLIEIKLFGSKARGDSRRDSDIDVLVITGVSDWRVRDIVYGVVIDIFLEDGIDISPKVINKKDYEYLYKKKTPFIKNVIKDGITI